MKPILGITPLWMLPGYMDGITQAGEIPFIFPSLFLYNEMNPPLQNQ